MFGILDLLALRGFERHRAKLVRHQDQRGDVHDLIRRGWFETYQAYQSKPVFDDLDFIISFIGIGGTKALFVGIYSVQSKCSGREAPFPSDCPYVEWKQNEHFYNLRKESGFEDLEHRIVIEWGKGAIQWHQHASNKEVLEILPKGQLLRPFRDYLGFTLTHSELCYLFAHEEANREWRSRLSAVAGIYLVLATTNGAQYVGSAYGVGGIWGRWAAYARDGHGGNVLLRQLILADAAYPSGFSYSILQILPKTFAQKEVIEWESLYKEKLGSRATGLNEN
jgi:hypothetical protein